jgi:hypothetical protein
MGLPNGLELSCPAEAGRLPLIVAHRRAEQAASEARPAGRRSPAFFPGGQPKVLVIFQGFSELLGAGRNLTEAESRPLLRGVIAAP